jgi:hypothetical protein
MPPGHVRFPQALGRSQEAAAALEPALTSMIDDGCQEGIPLCAKSITVLDAAEGRPARDTTSSRARSSASSQRRRSPTTWRSAELTHELRRGPSEHR